MRKDAYLSWKHSLVVQAFASKGIDLPVEEVWSVPHHSRRRAVFSARRTKKSCLFGFRERKSHDIVDIENCLVLRERIIRSLPHFRRLMSHLLTRKGYARVTVTDTLNGLDVCVEDAKTDIDSQTRQDVASLAREAKFARLIVNGDIFYMDQPPMIECDGVIVEPVSGGFLQASQDAEDKIRKLILEAVIGAKKIADLFCGIGAFALPLAKNAEIMAVELDELALQNLKRSASHSTNKATNLKPVYSEQRDLFQEPLLAKELNRFDAVIFDPPRAGAIAQAQELAKSNVAVIVAVSCNPKTLARDARVLLDGGYRIEKIVPIDQFLYSDHVEVVCIFKKS